MRLVGFHSAVLDETLAGLLGGNARFHAQFLHRLGQDLLVGFKAHVGDEAALLRAQQVAGAADVQVLHRDVETAAQVGELLDGLQAAPGVLRDGNERRNHQIAERLPVGAAHAAPQLMQVGKAMMVVHRSMS